MTDRLANRTAIVTGVTSGISRAIAEVLGGEGAQVFPGECCGNYGSPSPQSEHLKA